jgi:hypothetical protein
VTNQKPILQNYVNAIYSKSVKPPKMLIDDC